MDPTPYSLMVTGLFTSSTNLVDSPYNNSDMPSLSTRKWTLAIDPVPLVVLVFSVGR
ncbi:uncharacterized protein METZ01_LOCUS280631 [marine metagenome]|uniref:Uncharacterized protein n=1 Tax=marine metagenome TaxID=408172 RepID=A0A382KYE0_9ZZZZ